MRWDLDYWNTGEWQAVEERLNDIVVSGSRYNPGLDKLFMAMDVCNFDDVRCAIIGQDPYPDCRFATGVAFDIPTSYQPHQFPPTLQNILTEYVTDLHYPRPASGSLRTWCERGVFLWNSIPTCTEGKSASHRWPEWEPLTIEIVQKLSKRSIVFVFLGNIAQRYRDYVTFESEFLCVSLSHPSPLGVRNGKHSFMGSRMFTSVNDLLVSQGKPAIDWKL